jgi:hypothetical protein
LVLQLIISQNSIRNEQLKERTREFHSVGEAKQSVWGVGEVICARERVVDWLKNG